MHVTEHAIDRFRQRFSNRNMADESRDKIRAYLLRMVDNASEITPMEHTDTIHKVTHRIVFVIDREQIVTVFQFDKKLYRNIKHDRFRYNNCSFWKRNANGCAPGH